MSEQIKCVECSAYEGHHPQCSKIDFDTAKKLLLQYYELWLTKEMWVRKREDGVRGRENRAWQAANMWKGKFFEVKHENNKLRRKTKPTP